MDSVNLVIFFFFAIILMDMLLSRWPVSSWEQRFWAPSIVTPWCPYVCPMGKHSLVSSEGWTDEQITHNTETSPSVAPIDVLHI